MNKNKIGDLIIILLSYLPLTAIFIILYSLIASLFKPLDNIYLIDNGSRYITILILALITSLLLCILSIYVENTKVNTINKSNQLNTKEIVSHILMFILLFVVILPMNEFIIIQILNYASVVNIDEKSIEYIVLIIVNLIISSSLTYNHIKKYIKK